MVDIPLGAGVPRALKPVAVRKNWMRSLCLKLLWRLADSQQSFRSCQEKSLNSSFTICFSIMLKIQGLLLKRPFLGLGNPVVLNRRSRSSTILREMNVSFAFRSSKI